MTKVARWTEQELADHNTRSAAIAEKARATAAGAKKLTPVQRFQALGRLKAGTMNKTEARFDHVLRMRQQAGEIAWFIFEAVKLMIAPNTSLTVDFFVMLSTGELQAIDVKGAKAIITDDSKVKMKVAAAMFPWPFFYAFPKPAKSGGGFEIMEV